jgi:hypothetical protein
MITILKLVAAAGIAWGVLNPSFTPMAADADCACKADTRAAHMPRADADCACKADAKTAHFVPKAEDCSCKAEAD